MVRKIILFISSYIPLYVLMVIKNIFERTTDGGVFLNVWCKAKNAIFFDEINDYAVVFLIIISFFSLRYLQVKIKKTKGEKFYTINEVHDETSNSYFNYISIYLLSCLGLTLDSIVDNFVFVFLMLIVGYIYISNNMTYMNPTLNLLGYKVYDVEMISQVDSHPIESIVVAKKNIKIEKGIRVKGTGKRDFVIVTQHFEET